MTPLDEYFERQPEPLNSCLIAARDMILAYNESITISWKWKTPFFSYKGKMLAYLNVNRKSQLPYLGLANGAKLNHHALQTEGRKMIKAYYFSPEEDMDIDELYEILKEATALCQ